ncbi:hypothetical protein [Pelosinus sp. UFO1]|uniref:hypothetical protein n=1 Tax=Pelosinus sp. UFO1 TaxID=484770 RepID=UPI0004D0CDE9|nr:hypothetical protein [Pelosinus sp. UFO1]AIF49786.1 hypothetical protein UFO1_0225 [Pelosinus sp. UFO1]
MSYGNSDGSDGSSNGGYGGDSSSSSSAGGYGGDSSSSSSAGGYGGDSSSSNSGGGYGGDGSSNSSSSSCGDDSSSSSSSGNFGSDSSSSSSNDDSNSNSSSADSTSDSSDNSDSGSSSDSSNVNSNSSAAAENTSSVDSSSSLTGTQLDGSAGNSLNPSEGIVGGTPCSEVMSSYYNSSTYNGINLDGTAGATLDSSETATAYSFTGYISDNYDSTVASSYQSTMDMSGFQNTEVTEPSLLGSAWNSLTQWADQNVVQPIQTALNTPLQTPESTSVADLLADNVPGMTKDEVENGLSNMGLATTDVNSTTNMIGDDPDAISNWAAANGIQPTTVTPTETAGVGNLLNQAINWDDEHANPAKNLLLNSGDTGIAQGIDSLKEVTVGKVSVPSLGLAAELEVAEKSLGISALKGISKLTGPLNMVSTGYDIYGDFQKYEGKNLVGAVGADLLAYGAGVTAAAVCVTFSAPAIIGVGICTGVAVGAGLLVNYVKSTQLSKK